jgi:hypothetical protein
MPAWFGSDADRTSDDPGDASTCNVDICDERGHSNGNDKNDETSFPTPHHITAQNIGSHLSAMNSKMTNDLR